MAYVNHGSWIADCPAPTCDSAEPLMPGQRDVQCRDEDCGQIAPVVWPPNLMEIGEVLAERPIPADRNWFPKGHPWAARGGFPEGQTPAELREENEVVAKMRAEQGYDEEREEWLMAERAAQRDGR